MIRVLLADDQQLVRRGVRSLLETAGFHVVAEASDGFEAVQLAERLKPEVAVLDLAIPLLNGADAAREIRRACPETRAVILTVYDEPHHVLAALRAGVTGYVLKTKAPENLIQAIQEVSRGGTYLASSTSIDAVLAGINGEAPSEDPLTPRERQVVQLVAAPVSFGDVGGDLLISNFGSGEVVAYRMSSDLMSFSYGGLLRDANNKPIVIEGLRGIGFGNGQTAGPLDTLFFTAGPNNQQAGLFGRIDVTAQ